MIWIVRFPFFVTALLCLLFFIGQAQEILRVMAADATAGFNWRYWFATAAAVWTSLGAWYFSRLLLDLTHSLRGHTPYEKAFERQLPRVLGIAIPIFLAWAAWVGRAPEFSGAQGINRSLDLFIVAELAVAGLLYAFFFGRRRYLKRRNRPSHVPEVAMPSPFQLHWSQWVPALVAGGVWLVCLILFWLAPVRIAPLLGPLAVLIVGLGCWIPLGSFFAYFGMYLRIPFLLIFLLCACVFTFFDWNDNHAVRTIVGDGPPRTWGVNEYFDRWLTNRADLHTNNYPVFLVATEGGGIRAAYNTAMVLGSIQQQVPDFSDHLFAISGVSGGSIGATFFTMSRGRSEGVRDIFTGDLLSPLLSMGLFPDLLQRFLPFRIRPWDRARGLEHAFEHAFSFKGVEPLTNSFFGWHNPPDGKLRPALLLNSTEVATGQRMTLSPFDHSSFGFSRPLSVADVSDDADLSLSSAMVLSARFPVFTAPGHFVKSATGQKHRFVDGGYYENSGAASVLDLFSSLKTNAAARHCQFYIIRIGHELSLVAPTNTSQSLPKHESAGLDELGPVFALLNVREARGDDAVRQLFDAYRSVYGTEVISFEWKEESIPIPLGWFISNAACESLDEQFNQQREKIDLVSNALRKK
jgi:hypothetical protein